MAGTPIPLDFDSGVQRDGTRLDSTRALDALWCRWRLRRPRKMGGFLQITDQLLGVPRRIHCFYQNSQIIAHIGTANGIQQVIFDQYGNLIAVNNRTPVGFVAGPGASFTFDAIFDTTSSVVQLVAHAAQNANSPSNTFQTVPFIGFIDATTPLVEFSNPNAASGVWVQPKISGGVFCVQPYVFDFDSSGLVQWSGPNLPLYLGITGGSTGAGQARISAQKIVAGMPLRGGGVQSPAAVFWSLSEVITASYIGGSAYFAFNTVSPSSSILSGASAIEYDGLYFWLGVDRAMVYNGVVSEVPNNQNQDWFFNNLTPGAEGKTFAFKVPRYGEIWWCAPMFGNQEPSHALIFNLRENCFYDTALPNGGRGAGYFAQGFRNPIMGGVTDDGNGYSLWMHETGTDQFVGGKPSPVRSYFETPWYGGLKEQQPNDNGLSTSQLEPDFVQNGDLDVYLVGAQNERAPENAGPSKPLLQVPSNIQEQFVGFKETHRLTRLHVESNVVGGNYIAGKNFLHVIKSDPRLMT